MQKEEYASTCKVIIKTDKSQISDVRVVGPLRNYTQVEISKTDAYKLGIDPPVKNSGDLEGASKITIIGPCGEIVKNCCIIANRHIHINKQEREERGLAGIDVVSIKLGDTKQSILNNVFIKETENGVFELHIDTDDANATLTKTLDEAELII